MLSGFAPCAVGGINVLLMNVAVVLVMVGGPHVVEKFLAPAPEVTALLRGSGTVVRKGKPDRSDASADVATEPLCTNAGA